MRRLIILSVIGLLLSACGSAPEESPDDSQAAAVETATVETPTAETPTVGGEPTGEEATEPTAASESPTDAIADLRSRLEGQSLRVGTSASANPAITGAVHTVRYLEDTFGMDVELRQLDSDPLVAAVISGDVSVGQLSLAGTAAGTARGAGFLAFAGDDRPNPYYVVARAPVDSLEDVRGQAFGATSNLEQITGQTATACLDSVGIDIREDVNLVQLANTGAVADALRSEQIVAGLTAPHRMAPIFIQDGADAYNIICLGHEVSPQLNNVWMADESWVEENEDIALAFAIASIETGRWAHAEREEWIELALEAAPDYEREAAEVLYETYVEEMDLWPVNGSLDRELCDATLQSSLESGALEEPMSCEDVVTFEFQERALEILGEV